MIQMLALIFGFLGFVISLVCVIFMLAKHFSTHHIQYVNPLESMMGSTFDPLTEKMGKNPLDEFAEIGATPIDEDQVAFTKKVK